MEIKRQKGVGLFEMLLFIGISIPVSVLAVNQYIEHVETKRAQVAGEQLSIFNDALSAYIKHNYAALVTECATGCIVTPELSNSDPAVAAAVRATDVAGGATYAPGDVNAQNNRMWFVLRDINKNLKANQLLSYKREKLHDASETNVNFHTSAKPFLPENFNLINSYGGTYAAEIRVNGGRVRAVSTLSLDAKQQKYLGEIVKWAGVYAGQFNKNAKLTTSQNGFSFDLAEFSQVTTITNNASEQYTTPGDLSSSTAAVVAAPVQSQAATYATFDDKIIKYEEQDVPVSNFGLIKTTIAFTEKYTVDNGTTTKLPSEVIISCLAGYTFNVAEQRCKLNCSSIFAN